MKKFMVLSLIGVISIGSVSCVKRDDAQVASYNLSQDADNFRINRRTVFYNGHTGEYLLSIEGRCSITKDNTDNQLEVTCKTNETEYKKHYLGLSNNVTYFSEQIDASKVSVWHYRVEFKPQSIFNDYSIRTK